MLATRKELEAGTHRHTESCNLLCGHVRKYVLHQLEDAVAAVLTKQLGERAASRMYNIPLTTLFEYTSPTGRFADRAPGHPEYRRVLNDVEEKALAEVVYAISAFFARVASCARPGGGQLCLSDFGLAQVCVFSPAPHSPAVALDCQQLCPAARFCAFFVVLIGSPSSAPTPSTPRCPKRPRPGAKLRKRCILTPCGTVVAARFRRTG